MPVPPPDAGRHDGGVGGAVLAGGGSTRMGRDKAGIEVAGASLLARARAALASALGPAAPITAVGTPHGSRPGPWIPDLRPDAGPLAGLEAALAWGRERGLTAVLLVGVDHPWLEPAVLRLLVERLTGATLQADAPPTGPAGNAPTRADGVVLGTDDGPLLLLGAYRTTALATVAALLDRDERRLQALRHHLDLDVVTPAVWRHLDPRGATAVDVDDPAGLEAARRHLDDRAGPAR